VRHIGTAGEEVAKEYLEAKGYAYIAKNWNCRVGEIDLIMRDGATLVLIEVKLRSPTIYAAPDETITYQKQRKIIKAAKFYQVKRQYWGDCRFDVIAITKKPDGMMEIEHIQDAFSE
jgi:putative endonuclease